MMVNSLLKDPINSKLIWVNHNSIRLPTLKQNTSSCITDGRFVEEKGLTVSLLARLSIFVFKTLYFVGDTCAERIKLWIADL